jgi:hypothetical protein
MKQGVYVYCVVPSQKFLSLKPFELAGIAHNEVYALNYKDLAIVIHDCHPVPYSSKDPKKASEWIKSHHEVINCAWETGGAVLPFSFNTIIRDTDRKNAFDNALEWLEEEYDVLKTKLAELRGKAEFGVKFFWNREEAAKQFLKRETSLLTLQKELQTKGEGGQFLIQEKIEKTLRRLLEQRGTHYIEEILDKVKNVTVDYKVEKVKEAQEILSLSCLAEKENPKLGKILDEIQTDDELNIHFTGPWPPYSFVNI